jgi:hypothetical protein
MRIVGLLVSMAALVLLQGCTISQNVKGVGDKGITQIKIIENTAVKSQFLEALKTATEKQGVTLEVIPSSSLPKDSPYAMTYTANWAWDMALYLVYTEINVYQNGQEIGKAVYDARRGSGNMGKFINAEKKVDELVTELFAKKKPD